MCLAAGAGRRDWMRAGAGGVFTAAEGQEKKAGGMEANAAASTNAAQEGQSAIGNTAQSGEAQGMCAREQI